MTTKNKQADDAIQRAAKFMIAGGADPLRLFRRRNSPQRRDHGFSRGAVQLCRASVVRLDGAVETVRDEVLTLVRDHFERLVPQMAPKLVGIETETEAARIVQEWFEGSSPIKQ
jgi:hypothetical protein